MRLENFFSVRIGYGVQIADLALYLEKSRTLVVADLHIGYEEALNKQGILLPRFQFRETVARLKRILDSAKPKKVIINGDLKHEFGGISVQEWRETLKVLDLILTYTDDVVLLRGNHDTIIGPIAEKRHVRILDEILIGSFYITHGHRIPESLKLAKPRTVIIGHEHPAVGLREGLRTELFKCFLVGEWRKKRLIVIPSFNTVVEGTDILKNKLISPFLQNRLDNFRVYIVDERVYKFGMVRDL